MALESPRLTIWIFFAATTCASLVRAEEPALPKYDGYLFAYFEGSGPADLQEQLRFAVSADAQYWVALNGNRPIVPSSEISQTGGIRDPHLLRTEDGNHFYLVATDMHTMRDGWDFNPGMVLMRSTDLVDWQSTSLDFTQLYPERFGDVQWVWAPQTIYDPQAEKYLVYFTIRFRGQNNLDFYSAYANADFTAFEAEPKLMFRMKDGAIDADIVHKDGVYHLFFKGYTQDRNGKECKNGIKQATSRSLQGPWVEHFNYLDAYANKPTVVEGSSVFKLNDSNQYVLMYDLYSDGRYEFQRSTDLYHFTPTTESFEKDFHPRHGSVIGITQQEAIRLNEKWSGIPDEMLEQISRKRSYTEVPDPALSSTGGNPIITDVFTADPAPLVVDDTVYLYVGHDEARPDQNYNMPQWLVYSSKDLVHWQYECAPLAPRDFQWATRDAYAAHVAQRDGKYYFYVSTEHNDEKPGKAIGVAVADDPTGPFVDARGSALVTADMTPDGKHSWEDIDPAVFTDDDGVSYLFWGNLNCYWARLKENMIELDGPINQIAADQLVNFTEAPWIHKKGGLYYLTYASGFPEKIAYSTAEQITGPWKPRGLLAEMAGNSNTIHQGIIRFKGKDYFFYHNGSLQQPNEGGSFRRSVCIDELHYNDDGTLQRVIQTTEGIEPVK